MSRTKGSKTPGVFDSSGYKGVHRQGSKFAWTFVSGNGQQYRNGGYDTKEEAAYAYDEFVIKTTNGNGITNQVLGLLKPRDIIKIREKLSKQEIHKPSQKPRGRAIGATGFKGVRLTNNKKHAYTAQCTVKGKYVHIGSYETAELAARAYDDYIMRHVGVDADTNLSLGLLPALSEPVFNKDLNNKTVINNNDSDNTVNDGNNNYHPLSPDEERERQIATARLLMKQEEEQEQSKKAQKHHAEPATSAEPLNTPTPEPHAPIEHVEPPAAPEILSVTVKASPTRSIPPATADIMTRAIEAMKEVWEEENNQERQQILSMYEKLAVSVKGYQAAVNALIDHGAELETQLQELRKLLKK